MNQILEDLKEYLKKMKLYEQATSLLYWDLHTAAPRKSVESKLDAIGFFSTENFRLSTAPEYGQMLEQLSQPDVFDS